VSSLRTPGALAALIVAAIAPAAMASTAPVAAAATPSAELTLCRTGPREEDRSAAFEGAMLARSVPGTHTMAMRFDLRSRAGAPGVFAPSEAPTFGVWERSRARRAGFVFTKRLERLAVPGAYRVVVRFRWYDRRGRLLRATSRTSRACAQPDLRPDLVLRALPDAPSVAGLRVAVRNVGRGSAGGFDLSVAVGEAPATMLRIAGLGAGERRVLTLDTTACRPGLTVRVGLDAGDVVEEVDEAGALLQLPCPPAR
jgi:CARDB